MVAPKPQLTVPQIPVVKDDPIEYSPSDYFDYDPQPDITAYEVAILLKLGIITINYAAFSKLPAQSRRHFRARPRQGNQKRR